jgi:hypothetical protein
MYDVVVIIILNSPREACMLAETSNIFDVMSVVKHLYVNKSASCIHQTTLHILLMTLYLLDNPLF